VSAAVSVVWALAWLILRDWRKAALVSAVVFSFSLFHGFIRDFTKVDGTSSAFVWLALLVVGVVVVVKLTRPAGLVHITTIANVFAISTLVVCLVSLGSVSAATSQYNYQPVYIGRIPSPPPDVYYIIPDTYASDYILRTYLDYDNSLTGKLESRGFNVTTNNFANYHHSIHSITSVLNMSYLTTSDSDELFSMLVQNPVADTFKEAGYTYVHIGSWWSYTSSNLRADIVPQFSRLSELDFALLEKTLWYDLLGGKHLLREATLGQFENLTLALDMEGPVFTFCHLILPHSPFIFDSSGGVPRINEWSVMYLDQLEYTNKLLLDTIDAILDGSDVVPIIVIAADEGYAGSEWYDYATRHSLSSIVEDRPDLALMRQGTIFAIHNPYGEVLEFPKSPVNTFRYVFNSIFDSGLEYLPDHYFLRSLDRKFRYTEDFIEITEWIETHE